MAKTIIVGRKDCPVQNVVFILKENYSFHMLYHKWAEIARDLDIPEEVIQKMRHENLLGMTSLSGIIFEIITHWVAQNGKEATLNILIECLEENGLRSCAKSLEKAFRVSRTNKLEDQHVSSEKSDDEMEEVENEEDNDEEANLRRGSTGSTIDRAVDADQQILPEPKKDDDQIGIHTFPEFSPDPLSGVSKNKLDLLGSILEVSPFCDKTYHRTLPFEVADPATEIASFLTSKPLDILILRDWLFIIVCCFTFVFSLIDFLWESYQFIYHVKGTNKVDSYIGFFTKVGKTALRLSFLYVANYKMRGFAEDLEQEYPKKLYKKIFYGKYYLISILSLVVVFFLTTAGFWMSPEYFQSCSEMDKIIFFDSFTSMSKNYYTLLIGLFALFRFFLMITEQYALDWILVVAIIFYLEMSSLMRKAKLYFRKSKRENAKQYEVDLGYLYSCWNALQGTKNVVALPLETDEVIKKQLQFEYINIRGIFRSTNRLIGSVYSISLFIGLLFLSSFEDILLNSNVNIVDKLEYAFVFVKLFGIVCLGCLVSNKLQDLHGEDYAKFFIPVDVSSTNFDQANAQNADDQNPARSSQRRRTIKRKKSTGDMDLSSLSDLKKENPIGLGSQPFSMDVKFLAHHIGLAFFTIFLGIVSTRDGSNDCDVTKTLNNSLIVNGTYYECILSEKPVEVL